MRVFISFLCCFAVFMIGIIIWFSLLITGEETLYIYLVPVGTIVLMIIVPLLIKGCWRSKGIRYSILSVFSAFLLVIAGYESYQAYLRSLEVVSAQDMDLSIYQPFKKGTIAVKLDEKATLHLQENLPILDGSTALYPVYAAFAQAVYPEKEYPLEKGEVVSTQTSVAFECLLHKEVDIAFLPEPSEKQKQIAKKVGVELSLTPIGKEAFVFFVHKDNPVQTLSIEQLQGIYSGNIKNWKEVGGEDEVIRAFQRPEESGSQSALIRFMRDTPLMDPPTKDIVAGMGGIITETVNYQNRKNAIGFSFRYYSQEMVDNGKIKNIAVEGVLPTVDSIRSNQYPIVSTFYAVTTDSGNQNVQSFIEWMQSEQGRYIVEKTGYVSVGH